MLGIIYIIGNKLLFNYDEFIIFWNIVLYFKAISNPVIVKITEVKMLIICEIIERICNSYL